MTLMNIADGAAHDLQIRDVHVAGAGEAEAQAPLRLRAVTLTLSPGEWIYIAGTNGSGKSTLARMLAGLSMEGVSGAIDRGFAGEYPAPYVMQQPDAQLFGETPREEIMFALEWMELKADEIDRRTAETLSRTGLGRVADVPWDRLSGGQRQLAAIAAAVAAEAPMLVLDEATSMLDDQTRAIASELIRERHAAGSAIVWVTQRLDELMPEQRVLAIKDGELSFDGRARDFFYGWDEASGVSPCEASGLQPSYLMRLALAMRTEGLMQDPLPMTEAEWREVVNL
ncbi:energy-coupling factor ABC transporter ATP-binding protein [Paenibacillus methanolicus]|uniref:Energy-coupling factor transport system ATP-binding protein/energy-coupling factor transport system ATP-binding protein n=1 Tax=Paenibacillus methanolicus TaxID=582686 RepID=A0A5S5CLG1_9BACL|nr:ABC transporter ATP-binding protein [Paenibacillus methanolicus]TYP79545.1 energy-coupling factor transport system ATP-binding protein/energy-coupling factor transport system ATP-binding protein [Paenibacillus methanolicus]